MMVMPTTTHPTLDLKEDALVEPARVPVYMRDFLRLSGGVPLGGEGVPLGGEGVLVGGEGVPLGGEGVPLGGEGLSSSGGEPRRDFLHLSRVVPSSTGEGLPSSGGVGTPSSGGEEAPSSSEGEGLPSSASGKGLPSSAGGEGRPSDGIPSSGEGGLPSSGGEGLPSAEGAGGGAVSRANFDVSLASRVPFEAYVAQLNLLRWVHYIDRYRESMRERYIYLNLCMVIARSLRSLRSATQPTEVRSIYKYIYI